MECKVTRRRSYAISVETMDAVTATAAETGRIGALHIRFLDDRGVPREFVVMEASILQDLT